MKKTIEIKDESLKSQNYSLSGLLPHTTYIITLAAKNLEGMGPEAVIELRTENGGRNTQTQNIPDTQTYLSSSTPTKAAESARSVKRDIRSKVEVSKMDQQM